MCAPPGPAEICLHLLMKPEPAEWLGPFPSFPITARYICTHAPLQKNTQFKAGFISQVSSHGPRVIRPTAFFSPSTVSISAQLLLSQLWARYTRKQAKKCWPAIIKCLCLCGKQLFFFTSAISVEFKLLLGARPLQSRGVEGGSGVSLCVGLKRRGPCQGCQSPAEELVWDRDVPTAPL